MILFLSGVPRLGLACGRHSAIEKNKKEHI